MLCFPQWDLPILALLFPPALIFCAHQLRSPRQAVALGFLLSAMISWGGFPWIIYVAQNFGDLPLWAAVGLQWLFCLIAGLQMVAFLLTAYYLRYPIERLPLPLRPLFWAALYVGYEYLARFTKIFPEHLGNTWIYFQQLAQAASLGGVSLLTFLPLYLGASFAYLRKEGRRAWIAPVTALALVAGLHFWGGARIGALKAEPSQALSVGFVQHRMEEMDKLAQRTGGFAAIDALLGRLLHHSRDLAANPLKPDLLLWPETAYPMVFPTGGRPVSIVANGYANLIKQSVATLGIPLLFGGYESEDGKEFNSGILLSGTGEVETTYRKEVLLIFGEYMPLDQWIPSLRELNPQIGNFGRGPGPMPISFRAQGRDIPLGVNICYEAILPEYIRGLVNNGARLLVNLTKDSWFGDTFEPWQHFQLTALRAIEHGLPLVRATNTGLSGYVLPTGETHLLSPPYVETAAVLSVPVPLQYRPTLYTLLGEWFAWVCLGLSLALGFWAYRK